MKIRGELLIEKEYEIMMNMKNITRVTFLLLFFMFFIVLPGSQYVFSASNNSDTVNVIPAIIIEFSSFDVAVDVYQPTTPPDAPVEAPADAPADAPVEEAAEETDEEKNNRKP